jgi:hypothetical protein
VVALFRIKRRAGCREGSLRISRLELVECLRRKRLIENGYEALNPIYSLFRRKAML